MISLSIPLTNSTAQAATLHARPMGIDSYQEPVVYMSADCPVCRSEGFKSPSLIQVSGNGRSLIATLNVVHGEWLGHNEAGLSEAAWTLLAADAPCPITVSHPEPVRAGRTRLRTGLLKPTPGTYVYRRPRCSGINMNPAILVSGLPGQQSLAARLLLRSWPAKVRLSRTSLPLERPNVATWRLRCCP